MIVKKISNVGIKISRRVLITKKLKKNSFFVKKIVKCSKFDRLISTKSEFNLTEVSYG